MTQDFYVEPNQLLTGLEVGEGRSWTAEALQTCPLVVRQELRKRSRRA